MSPNSALSVPDVPTWVVFCDAPNVGWLKCLRPGFRHCFVVQRHGRHYVTIDPILSHLEIMTHPFKREFDLIKILKDQGLTVVFVGQNKFKRKYSVHVLCTCVTITKRILGLYAPCILTPYGLYRTLTRASKTPPDMTPF